MLTGVLQIKHVMMKWLTCSSADHLETMNRTLHLRSRGDSGVVPKPCVHMKSSTGDHNYVHHYFLFSQVLHTRACLLLLSGIINKQVSGPKLHTR